MRIKLGHTPNVPRKAAFVEDGDDWRLIAVFLGNGEVEVKDDASKREIAAAQLAISRDIFEAVTVMEARK